MGEMDARPFRNLLGLGTGLAWSWTWWLGSSSADSADVQRLSGDWARQPEDGWDGITWETRRVRIVPLMRDEFEGCCVSVLLVGGGCCVSLLVMVHGR